MKLTAAHVKKELKSKANPEKAAFFPRFFKAGPGEYAEGDQFFGVIVPQQRIIAAAYRALPLEELNVLISDPVHECRLTAILILVQRYVMAKDASQRKTVFDFYRKNIKCVNNWDLVDSSAHKIAGPYVWEKQDYRPLQKWIDSKHLWSQRAAVIATLYFIKQGHLAPTLDYSLQLMGHSHDLIHKATGWMLREAGAVDHVALLSFLDQYHLEMPRTMLRYAIEKMTPQQRAKYVSPRKPKQ